MHYLFERALIFRSYSYICKIMSLVKFLCCQGNHKFLMTSLVQRFDRRLANLKNVCLGIMRPFKTVGSIHMDLKLQEHEIAASWDASYPNPFDLDPKCRMQVHQISVQILRITLVSRQAGESESNRFGSELPDASREIQIK